MHKFITLVVIAILVTAAAGCATKRQTGAVTGAAAGTAVGAAVGDTQTAIIGGLLGTIVGHEVGRYMDEQDREETYEALEFSETGQTTDWVNPDTGRSYYVTPQETFAYQGQEPCREFALVTREGSYERRTTEIACRRADGSWEIQG
jgi:surface antigen